MKEIVKPSGQWIRQLREQRELKPRDIENITRRIAQGNNNPDFYLPHTTLAGIEAGSTPTIHKLYSLSIALRVPMSELLLAFGIDLYTLEGFVPDVPPRQPPFRFQLHFDRMQTHQETTLLDLSAQDIEGLPAVVRGRIDVRRFRYALIGPKDDTMADLIPPRSLVEIDTVQKAVQIFPWRALAERPIYLVWHGSGHTCCWCQLNGRDLTLIPHPLSRRFVRQYKTPDEATVIGQVTSAWLPLSPTRLQPL